ncbi:sensor histidine kinase [Peptostreptococcus faecalis]|uniref:sensor histidine kinase n=1 Tax=Peptostreptococcus faecalis TaxID=2045015 RepID=UPI000C7D24CC|nr:GHKL domain-containing protein [Peptostreptococcus faecalis]
MIQFLETFINKGVSFEMTGVVFLLIMISFIRGKKASKKEVLMDFSVVIVATLIEELIASTGIYKLAIFVETYAFNPVGYISLILVLVYIKRKYKTNYTAMYGTLFFFLSTTVNSLVYNFQSTFIISPLFQNLQKLRFSTETSEIIFDASFIFLTALVPCIIMFLITELFLKKIKKDEVIFSKRDQYIFIAIYIVLYLTFATVIGLVNDIPYDREQSVMFAEIFHAINKKESLLGIGVLISGILNLYFYVKISNLYKKDCENKITESFINYTDKYLDKAIEHEEKISKLCHDFKNHMMVIASLKENGIEEVNEYLKPIEDMKNDLPIKVASGNAIADIILNEKASDMVKLGIKYDIKVAIPKDIKMEPHDLGSILFNTIDNAIDGSMHEEDGWIDIDISPKGKNLVYTISNSYNDKKTKEKSYSKKENICSGYGNNIVKNILKKYNGDMDIEKKDNKYSVSMYFSV